jgi:hypothetical protein
MLATRDIKECQKNAKCLETGLANLMMKQETTLMFSQILVMFSVVNASLQQLGN